MADNENRIEHQHTDGHHSHHHHHSHHYLIDVEKGHHRSHSSEKKSEKKERKIRKKIDLSEKPICVWLVLTTLVIAAFFLIFMPPELFISESYTISKWTAVSVCFSFTSMGSVLYLMRDRFSTSKTDGKVKKAIKGATQLVASSGLIILLIFAVINTAIVSRGVQNPDNGYITKGDLEAFLDEYQMKSASTESDRITLTTPEVINIAPEALNAVMTDDSSMVVNDILDQFRSDTRIDVGYPARISFTIEESLAEDIAYITVELSENESLEDSRLFTLEAKDRSVDVYHLKTGTEYFYRVNVFLSVVDSMNIRNRSGSFKTAATPRIITIDGARNVRDIGGWLKTEDGRKIRQGMIIRGTEIDGMVVPDYKATTVGISDLKEIFKIKSDFDLRAYNSSNPLDVNHIAFEIPMYEGIFTDAGKEKVKFLFRELADPVNYPIYLHCTYGTDRTGVMMYLLEKMLGVDDESVAMDYEFSAMYINKVTRENLFPVITELESYDGRNMQEKVRSYLVSCGVTEGEMQAIENILLEE